MRSFIASKPESRYSYPLLMDKNHNTFDQIYWNRMSKQLSTEEWIKDFGEGKLPAWYNKMTHSSEESKIIQNINVSLESMERIDKLVKAYFEIE